MKAEIEVLVDEMLLKRAELVAQEQGLTVSELVEQYFSNLIANESNASPKN